MQNLEKITVWREEIVAEIAVLDAEITRIKARIIDLAKADEKIYEEWRNFHDGIVKQVGNTLSRWIYRRLNGAKPTRVSGELALARCELENREGELADRRDALRQIENILNPAAPAALSPAQEVETLSVLDDDDFLFFPPGPARQA